MRRGSCFVHMVSRDTDRVESRHILRGILKYICDEFHRRLWRIDVCVAHHELLEDVVLYSAAKIFLIYALFFCCYDVKCHDGNHCTIHRHGYRHLIKGDLIKEDFHILHTIDRHTSLADISHHSRVIRVISSMCCQVKGYRQSLLSLC